MSGVFFRVLGPELLEPQEIMSTPPSSGGLRFSERASGAMLSSGDAVAVSADQPGALELRPAAGAVRFVAIGGPAINEPIVQIGPFVMNSREESEQAMADFKAGKFGTVTPFT